DVVPRVRVEHGIARRPGRHLHAHDGAGRRAGEAKGIRVAELVLGEEGQIRPIVEGAERLRIDAAQALAVRGIRARQPERVAHPLELERLELLARPGLDRGLEHPLPGRHAFPRVIASRTRSGVKGSSVMRTPIASRTALATAAATGITPDSPSPLAPNGPSGSTLSIRRTAMSGMSSALRIA